MQQSVQRSTCLGNQLCCKRSRRMQAGWVHTVQAMPSKSGVLVITPSSKMRMYCIDLRSVYNHPVQAVSHRALEWIVRAGAEEARPICAWQTGATGGTNVCRWVEASSSPADSKHYQIINVMRNSFFNSKENSKGESSSINAPGSQF